MVKKAGAQLVMWLWVLGLILSVLWFLAELGVFGFSFPWMALIFVVIFLGILVKHHW